MGSSHLTKNSCHFWQKTMINGLTCAAEIQPMRILDVPVDGVSFIACCPNPGLSNRPSAPASGSTTWGKQPGRIRRRRTGLQSLFALSEGYRGRLSIEAFSVCLPVYTVFDNELRVNQNKGGRSSIYAISDGLSSSSIGTVGEWHVRRKDCGWGTASGASSSVTHFPEQAGLQQRRFIEGGHLPGAAGQALAYHQSSLSVE